MTIVPPLQPSLKYHRELTVNTLDYSTVVLCVIIMFPDTEHLSSGDNCKFSSKFENNTERYYCSSLQRKINDED